MTTPATQTQTEDLFSVDQIEVKCPACGEAYLDRKTKTVSDDGTYSVYTMVCHSTTCRGEAVIKVPRSEEAQRAVPIELQIEESELHPDDGFSIAKLDVLLSSAGPSLVRAEKEPDEDENSALTTYFFRQTPENGTEVQVLVPQE